MRDLSRSAVGRFFPRPLQKSQEEWKTIRGMPNLGENIFGACPIFRTERHYFLCWPPPAKQKEHRQTCVPRTHSPRMRTAPRRTSREVYFSAAMCQLEHFLVADDSNRSSFSWVRRKIGAPFPTKKPSTPPQPLHQLLPNEAFCSNRNNETPIMYKAIFTA